MTEWITSHARPIVDSIIYSIIGTLVLLAAFWLIEKVLPFSMQKEIETDHNVSLGIILGAFILVGGQHLVAGEIGNKWAIEAGARLMRGEFEHRVG